MSVEQASRRESSKIFTRPIGPITGPSRAFCAPVLWSALFLLAGVFGLTFGDVTIGTKILLWCLHVLSGVAIYFYVKEISDNTRASLLSAVVYVFAFAHTHLVL